MGISLLIVFLLLGKHVRSCIVFTWDNKSSAAFWAGMKVLVFDGLYLALWGPSISILLSVIVSANMAFFFKSLQTAYSRR